MKSNGHAGSANCAAMGLFSLLAWQFSLLSAEGNPSGGTVVQGSASWSPPGSQFTINQTSANAFITWSSFNVAAGETTTFVQPSASSVTWNQISGPTSQIFGNINANGYVVLQNANGFYIGGSAVINTHGLVMTTAPTPNLNLSSGGAWQFDAPPPTASIINYGQVNVSGGGSLYLIASDIENRSGLDSANNHSVGSLSAPGGKIGLYAGQQVLVSMSPDGRGLSAQVTLPQGSVDNEGRLIADAGSIVAQAQTVNNNGLIQANSVRNVNGVIELVASGNLSTGPNSDLEANGDASAGSASPGGMVVLQAGNAAGNTFADTPTSKINVSGQNGGPDGIVEVFGCNLVDATSLQSQIGSTFALLVNPYDLTLSQDPTGTFPDANNNPDANFNVNDLAAYAQIDLHALDNIELSTQWSLNDPSVNHPGAWGCLRLQAGNSLILDDQSCFSAGNNWELNLLAGTGFAPTAAQPAPPPGDIGSGVYSDGIYLNGSAYVQAQNGDLNLWAANEVQLDTSSSNLKGFSGIRTLNGGSITVNAEYGDVNAGANPDGFLYQATAPYYTVSTQPGAWLGGISTAAGGNVTINAGGNVFSYIPSGKTSVAAQDGGSGAFGPEPGNVTISAAGGVYGHYVLADGVGSITAGQNVGAAHGNPFALSLIAGSWSVNAPNGNIYLQEVRNPNGIFNNLNNTPGGHLFDYSPTAAVDLTAGDGVYLTGGVGSVPRLQNGELPVLYPPILDISAGAGGVTLQGNVTLFPSPDQNLTIITTDSGNLFAPQSFTSPIQLFMSDSAQTQWQNNLTFSASDHGSTATELHDPNPVLINIAGSMENLTLITARATQIRVGGDMVNCGFSGQNLHATDKTSITVAGQIYNQSAYAFVPLSSAVPSAPAADLPPGTLTSWDNIFLLALNPAVIATLRVPSANIIPASGLAQYALGQASLFQHSLLQGKLIGVNPGFIYNSATGQFGFGGQMSQSTLSALSQPITVLRFGANGLPVTYTGADGNTYFATDTYNWVAPSVISTLFAASQHDPSTSSGQTGYRIGGPGEFDISAGSISLGNTYGILSCDVTDPQGGFGRYANLASLTTAGAAVNVTVAADQKATVVEDGLTILPHASLDMLTSTIAAIGGGDVNVTSTGGAMDLGTQQNFAVNRQLGFGVFTSGQGNVNVTALGNINIDGSRIATYNGGNIFVESLQGNVDVGTGGDTITGVQTSYVDPTTHLAESYSEAVYGSGIVANTLLPPMGGLVLPPNSATLPGNITVETPQGNITASQGGIVQEALGRSTASGPTINLSAGTPGGHTGNIDLGESGVIGGTVNVTANGNIKGLIISRQDSAVKAQGNFSGSVLAGGSADVSGGGTVSGTIVGVGGASVSGGSVTAQVLSQSANVNGAVSSTLGSSAGATATSSSAAGEAGSEAKQEVATTGNGDDDDKKHHKLQPLMQKTKRVTVVLPKT